MGESELKTKSVMAILLIIIGIAGILKQVFNIQIFGMGHFWPIFVLGPGLAFEWAYFSTRRSPGVLVPGGILTTLGCLFFFEVNTRWFFSEYTWPVYILAPAIGLFQLYLFGKREKGLLIPIGILTTIAVVSFFSIVLGDIFSFINGSLIWPIILIIIGIVVLLDRGNNHKE